MSADSNPNRPADTAKKKPQAKRGGLQAVDLLQQVQAVREETSAAQPGVSQRNSAERRLGVSQRNSEENGPGVSQRTARPEGGGVSPRNPSPIDGRAKSPRADVSQRNAESEFDSGSQRNAGAESEAVSQRNAADPKVSQRNSERAEGGVRASRAGAPQRTVGEIAFGVSQRNSEDLDEAVSQRNSPNGLRAYFSPITSGRRAGLVALSAIKTRHEGQVRRLNPLEDADFDDLVASIRVHGVIQPVSLTWDDGHDCFWTDYGHRRVAAARAAGLKMLPAIVATQGEDGVEPDALGTVLTQKQLIENLQRTQLPPVDIAHAINRLAHEGLSAAAIAQALGKSKSWVSKHQKILDLPPAVLERPGTAELGYELLYTIAAATNDPTERDALLEVAKAGGRPAVQHTLDVQRAIQSGNARNPADSITEALLPGIEPDKVIRAREGSKGRPKLPLHAAVQRAEKAVSQLQALAEALADPALDEVRVRAKALLSCIMEYRAGAGSVN